MTYTLADLRTLVRQRADMENSLFVSDPEIDRYINDSVKELFQLLVVTYGQEYFYTSVTRTTTAGTQSYAMPDASFKLLRVDVQTADGYEPLRPWKFPASFLGVPSTTRRRPGRLPKYRWAGANLIFEPEPPGIHQYRIHYVPRPTRLSADADELEPAFDDWAEYVVLGAAIKCLEKEESDATTLDNERMALREHIKTTAPPKDIGYPQTIVDDRCVDRGGDYEEGGWVAALAAEAIAEEDEELELAKIIKTTGNQAFTGGAAAATVTMTTTDFQTGSRIVAGTNQIVVLDAGYYQIGWSVTCGTITADTVWTVFPAFNGAILNGSESWSDHHSSASGGESSTGTVYRLLAASTIVSLLASHNDGVTSKNIEGATLTVIKLAST